MKPEHVFKLTIALFLRELLAKRKAASLNYYKFTFYLIANNF